MVERFRRLIVSVTAGLGHPGALANAHAALVQAERQRAAVDAVAARLSSSGGAAGARRSAA